MTLRIFSLHGLAVNCVGIRFVQFGNKVESCIHTRTNLLNKIQLYIHNKHFHCFYLVQCRFRILKNIKKIHIGSGHGDTIPQIPVIHTNYCYLLYMHRFKRIIIGNAFSDSSLNLLSHAGLW